MGTKKPSELQLKVSPEQRKIILDELIKLDVENKKQIEFVETIGGELRCEVCGKILAFLDETVHDENIGIKAHLCVTQHHCGQDAEPPEDIAF